MERVVPNALYTFRSHVSVLGTNRSTSNPYHERSATRAMLNGYLETAGNRIIFDAASSLCSIAPTPLPVAYQRLRRLPFLPVHLSPCTPYSIAPSS